MNGRVIDGPAIHVGDVVLFNTNPYKEYRVFAFSERPHLADCVAICRDKSDPFRWWDPLFWCEVGGVSFVRRFKRGDFSYLTKEQVSRLDPSLDTTMLLHLMELQCEGAS